MNSKLFSKASLTTTLLLHLAGIGYSQQLAFPTAEGCGKYAVGGRGGSVYEVTTLSDGGAGSLRDGLSKSGRTIVFRVSGTIDLKSPITVRSNTTIAGQTAPGDGICLKRYHMNIVGSDIIVRYIRVRFGNESGKAYDAISSRGSKNVIVDHVSASWSVDETLSMYHCDNITVQWSFVTESLYESNHAGGEHHGFAGIWGGPHASFHHNLIAHHSARSPRMSGATEDIDVRNNVIYNWGYNSLYGGENWQNGDDGKTWKYSFVNVVANYYKPGPATLSNVRKRIAGPQNKGGWGKWYVEDNYMYGEPGITADNWSGGVQGGGDAVRSKVPGPTVAIKQHTAEQAYELVLASGGCSFPKRDAVDARVAQEVRDGNATFGKGGGYSKTHGISEPCGMIDSQDEVGGWPKLNSAPAPTDSDHDGMPDAWETKNGLDPKNAEDRNGKGAGGYTNLEIYLNSLISGKTALTTSTAKVTSHGLHLDKMGNNTITYSFPTKSAVKLELFTITGKKVATLINETKDAGHYSTDYSGLGLTTGPYVCKLSTENTVFSRNMFLVY